MSLLLDIPQSDEKEAKLLGAVWNPQFKKWYVQRRADYPQFEKWIIKKNGTTALLCDYFYIVVGYKTCFRCHKITPVIGFGVKNMLFMSKSESDIDFPYSFYNDKVHISPFINSLPENFLKFLEDNFDFYLSYSRTIEKSYYANHCKNCGVIQGRFFLFNETDSPFCVDSIESASQLTLYKIKLKYDLICDFDLTIGSCDYLIETYASINDTNIEI